jgi:hypothetical protein
VLYYYLPLLTYRDEWYQFWVRNNWRKAHSENEIEYVIARLGRGGGSCRAAGSDQIVHIVSHRNTAQHPYSRATTRVPCGVVGAAQAQSGSAGPGDDAVSSPSSDPVCAAHAYWRSMTSLDAALCSNCQQRPIGHDLLCGFDDWCSVCDNSLWLTNPAVISVTQSRSFRRFEHPPYSRSYLELLRELRQLEST